MKKEVISNMLVKQKIDIKAIIHYLLIILLYYIPGSSLFSLVMPSIMILGLVMILATVTILFKKFRNLKK